MRLLTLHLCIACAAVACAWALTLAADRAVRAEEAVDCARVRAGAGHVSEWERQACR